MTKDEAIYCMQSYLPDSNVTHCIECPYYGKKKIDDQTSVCMSNEAHRMAVEALKRDDPEVEFQKRFEASTFCGYSSKELLLFADACRRKGITEDQLHSFLTDTESAFNYVMEKINEMFDEEIERQLS